MFIGKNNQQKMCSNDEIIYDNVKNKIPIDDNIKTTEMATATIVIPPTSAIKCIRKVKTDNCEVKAKMSVVKPQQKQEQHQQQQQRQQKQHQQQQQQQYACDNDKKLIKTHPIDIYDNNNKNYVVTNNKNIDKINVKCVSNNSESSLTVVCDKTSNDTCVNMLKKSESDDNKFINNNDNKNSSCYLLTEDGEEDPYAELEMYLAKVTVIK